MKHYRTSLNKIEWVDDKKTDWETIGIGILTPFVFYALIILISLL
jgi:hypothetical protein